MITRSNARSIIENMKDIIDENINFISTDGTVIASLTPERENTFHEGGLIVARTNEKLIVNYDGEYEGTLKGVNFPIYYEDKLVCVIGVSGDYSRIKKYVKIVAKMTELLLKEVYLNQQREFKRENNRYVFEEAMNPKFNSKFIYEKMRRLGFEFDRFDYLVVAEISGRIEYEYYQIFNSIDKRIPDDFVCNIGSKFYLLVNKQELEKIESIKEYCEKKYRIRMTIVVSKECNSLEDFLSSKLQLEKILSIPQNKESGKVITIDDIDINSIFCDISKELSNIFINKYFSKLTNDEIVSLSELIKSYVKNNGSIGKTGEDLFLHKNTVQNRLNKVINKVGLNPRDLQDLNVLLVLLRLHFINTDGLENTEERY